jgi:hypothetical protein
LFPRSPCSKQAQLHDSTRPLPFPSPPRSLQVWSLQQPRAALTLDVGANVCCVAHHPTAAHTVAVGSASHQALIYDLRAPRHPLATLRGHSKAVSYVRWLSDCELVTSSIDSTVRLWQSGAGGGGGGGKGAGACAPADGAAAAASGDAPGVIEAMDDDAAGWASARVFAGHQNHRNFVGLSVQSPFVACGSESNEVCVYYRGMSSPILQVPLQPPAGGFGGGSGGSGGSTATTTNVNGGGGGAGGGGAGPAHFVSSVCWREGGGGGRGGRGGGSLLAAANSSGAIWLLSLT